MPDIFCICYILYCKKIEKKTQRQIPITPQLLTLNHLKYMVQLNKIDYTTDFDNLYSRMDDFDKFFRN